MPYIFIGRCEKRKLTQFKNNLKISSVYDVQIKKRSVRSPRTLHNLSFKKRIYELRREGKKNFQ
jgi:hypothetical protein